MGISEDNYERATFSGGCFWCMQPPFDNLEGVISTTVGYTGGLEKNPTYDDVCLGRTEHLESVQIVYDPSLISYEKLLDVFWLNVDPTDGGGQFVDRGMHYRTAIFYHSEGQKTIAQESKKKLGQSGRYPSPIITEIRPAMEFYTAEESHQNFYEKNPVGYASYKMGSGRGSYIEYMKNIK
ncbi:MAG: peptide methionine sulfoxide reductase MsrA [Thermodesulfobacteriota bacterium]|nr:MAG: peptide methionine sulfoxide reductase MsrA [Thermodesulfobacteriota bacterium]